MVMDKKVRDKTLRFVLLRDLGEAYVSDSVAVDSLSDVIQGAARQQPGQPVDLFRSQHFYRLPLVALDDTQIAHG